MRTLLLCSLTLFLFACPPPAGDDDDATDSSSDARLSTLVLHNGAGTDFVLVPGFDSDTFSYTSVAPAANSVIKASGSTVGIIWSVNVNGSTADYANDHDWTSNAMQNLVSPETVTISVTAEDGETIEQYVVEVTDPT